MVAWRAAISLFLVINVIGNIPLFISLVSKFDRRRQRLIIFRELSVGLIVLLIFGFFGDTVLYFLQIHKSTIAMAGGVLLFLVSLSMVFPKHEHESLPKHEPMIVPLAIPTVAGPGAITAVMVFSHSLDSHWLTLTAIFIAWIPSLAIIMVASNIERFLGEKGLLACERLGGMLVCLIATQMIISGIFDAVKSAF